MYRATCWIEEVLRPIEKLSPSIFTSQLETAMTPKGMAIKYAEGDTAGERFQRI
jgi:hypothetical protein